MTERRSRSHDEGLMPLPSRSDLARSGTLEELYEVWSWQQLGYHDKPVALLNVDGYYDALLEYNCAHSYALSVALLTASIIPSSIFMGWMRQRSGSGSLDG